MKHIKSFEKSDFGKFYCSVYNEPVRFTKQLKKLGCSDNIILFLIQNTIDFDDDIIFVSIENNWLNTSLNVSNKGFDNKKFEYKGPVKLSEKEIEEIEIEENINKYNI